MKKARKGNGGQNPAEYFRKEFVVRQGVKRARVYDATCHGAYQLSINGNRADNRELAPECMVLLKSNGDFPLAAPEKVALYGSGARRTILGKR